MLPLLEIASMEPAFCLCIMAYVITDDDNG